MIFNFITIAIFMRKNHVSCSISCRIKLAFIKLIYLLFVVYFCSSRECSTMIYPYLIRIILKLNSYFGYLVSIKVYIIFFYSIFLVSYICKLKITKLQTGNRTRIFGLTSTFLALSHFAFHIIIIIVIIFIIISKYLL